MDPSWKVMNLASFSAALIVLIFACPCKGLRSQNLEFNLTVPASVSVQHGLCVHVPCNFTYDQRYRTSNGTLYGYWFQKNYGEIHKFYKSDYHTVRGILVATNDKSQTLRPSVNGRFQLTGNPEGGDCSFSVLDAKSEDTGEYYFRIEDNDLRYSYDSNPDRTQRPVEVLVPEFTEKPQIQNSSAVLSGKEAVFTCSVPGPCTKNEPSFSWITSLKGQRSHVWSLQHSNGSWTYGSNFTFTPFLKDQGRSLICRVWYPNIWKEVENAIHIDIADPPKTVEISTNATKQEHLAFCPPDSTVVQEGESISLHCKAESRPDPTLSWTKGSKTLNSSRQGEEQVLLLLDVRAEDDGKYQCRAETPHGSANKTLYLCVLYGPRLSSDHSTSTCWQEDNSLRCNCSLNSWPPLQIQWEVDGQTLSENSGPGTPEVTSRSHENEITSSLSWATGKLDESHNVICRGANNLGTYALHFLVFPPTKWNHASFVIAGLCGALVAIILCILGLVLMKFYKQRKAKASSKPGDVEVLNSANGGHQRANDGSLIYCNFPPLLFFQGQKSPRVDQSKAARERISTSFPRVPSLSIAEPEELHYATLEFSKLKAKQATVPEEFVEYTAVKQK
uniref:sialic acid-binding Ig-like lectin 14 n=1 Tax=Euleptes europaea TaxID=460621 RepID=UPI002540B9DE|nr:sialic acid-binding Ig-like lectin 14 [Euleptes europaea]